MIEKPKKERKFLKLLGKVGEILVQELLLKVGRSLVQKIGGKKTLPSIIFLSLFYNISFASIDSIPYPITGNKQRLGWQTTGNGLVYRGNASDTVTKPSNYANKDIKAYLLLDTVNNVLYNYISSKGGWQFSNTDSIVINNNFTQPVDSLFFDTSVPTNNVDTAKMRWDSDLGTVVLGMYDKVPNELGFKSFWLVKNQTGSTITKGSIVYANGTVGASGRITVAKFIANGSIDAKYLLGITAHDLTDGEDGYVISFGKIRQVNTDTFAAGSILYPSPTVAGVWTDVEPVAPNIDMPIGFCINSSVSNGTIAIRVASGYKLSELHDVAISSPVDKASLYYSGGLWRDTTAALLTSDTASMLTPYFRDADTTFLNLVSRFATKQNILNGTGFVKASGTTISYDNSTYLTTSSAASTYLPLTGGTVSGTINRQEGSHDGSSSTFYYNILNYFAKRDNNKGNQTAQITFTDRPGTATFENNVRTSDIYLMTARNLSGGQLGQYLDTTFSVVANQDGGRIGISKLNPAYKLDVNGTFNASGNSLIGGTLGVTGATTLSSTISATTGTFTGLNVTNASTEGILTLQGADNNTATRIRFNTTGSIRKEIVLPTATSNLEFRTSAVGGTEGGYSFYTRRNPNAEQLAFNIDYNKDIQMYGALSVTGATTLTGALTVNNATVLNEGSGDYDTRIESDGNANMVFVDASTDRVGIGTNTPSKTLDVNGEVKIATVTATPTALLGKDASNVVGEVTTVAQTGLMKAGGTTANTSSVGIITVAHGLSYTPSQVIATVAQQNSYVIVCHSKDGTNMSFTVYDSVTGNALNNVSVGFFWLAIK